MVNSAKSNKLTANAVYHQIYSKTTLVKQLLASFGPSEIVAYLDLNTLEPEPTKFFSEGSRLRDGDLSFRVRGQGHFSKVHVAIFIENQSRFDALMPLRMMEYVIRYSIHQFEENLQQASRDKLATAAPVPYILPIVLYNGVVPWKGVEHIDGHLEIDSLSLYPKGGPLSFYKTIPKMRSYLIAVHGMPAKQLKRHDHIISWMMQLERVDVNSLEFLRLYRKIREYQLQSAHDGLFSAIEALLWYVLYKASQTFKSLDERQKMPSPAVLTEMMMGNLQEFLKRPRAEMDQGERLAYDFYSKAEQFRQEGMEQGEQRGMERGIQQGEQRGIQQSVAVLLEQRFGEQGNTILAAIRNSGKNIDWKDVLKHAAVNDLASLARRYDLKSI